MTLDQFQKRLDREFSGRLRIRYSRSRHEYHIEQQVGRPQLPDCYIPADDDDLIRARDGYAFVLAVTEGDRTGCPQCHSTLRVPIMRTAEARCSHCRILFAIGYWPLGDALIEHLRRIDPTRRSSKERVAALDARNHALMATREKDALAEGNAALTDNWRRLFEVPVVGYTGKERYL